MKAALTLTLTASLLASSLPAAALLLVGCMGLADFTAKAREARDSEGDPQHNVGGLPAHPGKRHQVLHPRRHLTAEALDQGGRSALDRLRLLSEEAGRLDQLLDLGRVGPRQVGGRRPALE